MLIGYMVRGFETCDVAQERSLALNAAATASPPAPATDLVQVLQISPSEWAIMVPIGFEQFLDDNERRPPRLVEIKRQPTWHFRTPKVCRYMPQEFIDEFFSDGRLRLSCHREFAKHKDEERGDTKEGKMLLSSKNGGMSILAVTKFGSDAYMMSTTLREDPALMSTFGCDGYFRIEDTTAFANAVAQTLPTFRGGAEGHCIYQDNHRIERDVGPIDLESLRLREGSTDLDMSKMAQKIREIARLDPLFVKLNRYRHQMEYRFVWFVGGNVEAALDVVCPEARKVCTKVT